MTARTTPFAYINTLFYVYTIYEITAAGLVPIYVGRGKAGRARSYYRVYGRYLRPNTHNKALNAALTRIRTVNRQEAVVLADECVTLQDARDREAALIAQYGRLHLGTGTLCNRYARG